MAITAMLLLGGCEKAPDPANTDIARQVVWELRFGHDVPETSAQHLAAVKFAEQVKQRSGGRINIRIFPDQALGNDHEMIAQAQAGELDIILPPTAKLSTLIPEMQLLDIPYLFESAEQAHQVLDSVPGITLLSKLSEHGLVGAAFWESGFKQLTTNRPLNTVADLHGMRFRIMRSEMLSEQFNAWGAETMVIDFGKTLDALKDKVVDGQENPLGSIYNMKFHQAQSHLVLSQHGYLAQALVFSKISLQRMPQELQDILFDVAHEVTVFQRQQVRRLEKEFLEKIKQSGVVVRELPEELQTVLRGKTKQVLEKFRHIIGTEIIELALQKINESRVIADNEIVIGLDADLAGNSALSGLAIRRGIEIAMDEINAAGGVLGRKFTLLTRDNSMVSARGIENIRIFSSTPNLVAVFCGISSPVAISELDIIHENKILFLDPWAAATGIVDNNHDPNFVFRVSVRDEYAAGFLLSEALKVSSKVALLLANNDWGRSNHAALMHEFNTHKLTPVVTQWFDWGETRFEEKLKLISRSGAKVIVYVGNAIEGSGFIKHLATYDRPVPVISHWGVAGANFPKLVGEALDKIDLRVLQTFSFLGNQSPVAKKVVDLYRRNYSIDSEKSIIAPTGTAHAYDLVHLLARAITKAGSIDRAKIRNAMEGLGRYDGLVRTYNPPFSKDRHDALDRSDFFLATYKNGILSPIRVNKQ